MSNLTTLQNLTSDLALHLGVNNGDDLIKTLKETAFKEGVTDAQMTALMIVANQYKLNPWTKEIYAFPDRNNGIVPVVGVDGWSRIINSHPQFDGIEFEASENFIEMEHAKLAPEWIECRIYRKDRSRPIATREYLDEVYREPFKSKNGNPIPGPWQTHTKRFLRHKAMIQCARLAFGFSGIHDKDEAERIIEQKEIDMGKADVIQTNGQTPSLASSRTELPLYTDVQLESNIDKWAAMIESGKADTSRIIAMIESKFTLSQEHKDQIKQLDIKEQA